MIEIKSDLDSLRRFDEQVRVYSAVADRVTLVVGWSLVARALRAAPHWWDVVLAEREEGSRVVRLVPLRDGARNPDVAAEGLTAMLPLEDVRGLARSIDKAPRNRGGQQLRTLVATHVALQDLRAAVGEWLTRLSRKRSGTLF